MNRLPTPPPLPVEVRERALRTVLAGIDAPPRRRRAPFLAAAAAVVVALTVSTVVAVSGPRQDPDLAQLAGGAPLTSGDAVADRALTRCAAAVTAAGRQADYPPTGTWRTTEVLLRSRDENAVAVNDGFVCFAAASEVLLSSVRGTPAGAAEVMRLAPAVVVVTNPQRRAVRLSPVTPPIDGQRAAEPTDPVQILLLGSAGEPVSNYRLVVPGSYDGPLPQPAPVGLELADRPSTSRAPEPPGTSLDACLDRAMPGHTPTSRPDVVLDPPAQLARAGDTYAGFCVETPPGPVFAGGDPPSGKAPALVASRSVEGVTGALVVVPPDTTGVEITSSAARIDARCAVDGGLALCTLAAVGPLTITVYDADGRGTPVPVP